MKATQAGWGATQPKKEEKEVNTIPPRNCLICGKPTRGYGFVLGGAGVVCSRKCDQEHEEKERGRKHGA